MLNMLRFKSSILFQTRILLDSSEMDSSEILDCIH